MMLLQIFDSMPSLISFVMRSSRSRQWRAHCGKCATPLSAFCRTFAAGGCRSSGDTAAETLEKHGAEATRFENSEHNHEEIFKVVRKGYKRKVSENCQVILYSAAGLCPISHDCGCEETAPQSIPELKASMDVGGISDVLEASLVQYIVCSL